LITVSIKYSHSELRKVKFGTCQPDITCYRLCVCVFVCVCAAQIKKPSLVSLVSCASASKAKCSIVSQKLVCLKSELADEKRYTVCILKSTFESCGYVQMHVFIIN
jgi:hypothetical protein